jgi:hypothetical protein
MPNEKPKPNAPKDPEKRAEDEKLEDALEDTFPTSDPPANTAPGRGITGPEVKTDDKKK